MALYPITVNTPVEALPHIYAEDDAAIYESISGGDGVYDIGEMLKATVLSNNNVRIGNGVLSVGGHIARIKYGDYEEMTIDNGESGKNRNDLIVARFSTTGFGGVDEFSLEVKKGVAVTGAAKDPEVETGNLYEGETIREFPLHRVRLEGISIVAVDQLFAVRKTNEQLQKEVDELNRNFKESVYADGYMVVDIGALPNNSTKSVPANIPSAASEYWISNAWCKSRATGQVSPMPYIDASTWSNAIGITISASKNIVVTTKADWSAYSGKAVIAYKLSIN